MKRQIQQIAFLLFLFTVIPGNSASAMKFHADLTSIKVNAEPGDTVNRQFSMTLAPDQAHVQLHLSTQDFYRSADGTHSFYCKPGTLTHSCANWVSLNPADDALDPGRRLDARLTIAVPADIKPGGYWCVLTIDEVPDPLASGTDNAGVRFYTSISIGIFVFVGAVTTDAHIDDVSITPSTAALTLSNIGNTPFSASGRFEFVKPGTTLPVATIPLQRTSVFCEPIKTAILTAPMPDATALPAGRYLVRAILDIGLDHYIGVQKEMDVTRDTLASPAHP